MRYDPKEFTSEFKNKGIDLSVEQSELLFSLFRFLAKIQISANNDL